jgi:uncharacterized protein (DUF1499 family)
MIHSYLVIASAVAVLCPQSLAFPVVTTNTNLAASRTTTAHTPVTTTKTTTSSSSLSVSGSNTPTNTNTQRLARSTLDRSSSNNNKKNEDDDDQPARHGRQKNLLVTTETLSSPSRREWFSGTLALWTASLVGRNVAVAVAEEATTTTTTTSTTTTSYSIRKCPTGGSGGSGGDSKVPCLSTSNVRQLDLYLPPWTFTTSSADAMARLKGAIVADPLCDILHQDDNDHLVVSAKRNGDVFGIVDELEFVINGADQVVTFRSSAPTDTTTPDFGQNRKRLEDIRKRAGIFGIMGESLNSADSVSEGAKGYGPVGQLKAFYGLQSGGGFEDVFREN